MKKSLILIGTFLLATLSATAQAQNYYVCDNGDDNNDGRSEAAPFKTYDKAMSNFGSLEAGSAILFCRGGNFPVNNSLRLSNYKCNASKPCKIGDYGDEILDRPKIITNGLHAFNFENGGDARQDGGYIIENLILLSTEKNGSGIRLFNDVDDVTISNVHIEGFNIGVYSSQSNKIASGDDANGINDRLIIKNSTIIKNSKMGFLGACNDCLIENNLFENNGDKAVFDHNIYLAHRGTPANRGASAKGITIRNNTLYKSAVVDGKCQGVSLVGHGSLEDVLIENNIIREDAGKVTMGCWGISIDPGYGSYDESFKNIVIRKNKIINVGGVGIGCASCDGVTIESNEIIDEANTTLLGIRVPVRGEDSTKSNNVKVLKNKIVLSNVSASGVWVGGENAAKVFENEITLPTNTRVDCIILNQASLGIDISSNSCNIHNGISIIDTSNPSNELSVAENTVDEDIRDDENTNVNENNQVALDRIDNDLIIENDEAIISPVQPENIEVVENTPVAPVFEEPVFTEPEPEVLDSGSSTETVNTFQRPSWATSRPTSSRPFTLRDVISSSENNYSIVDESECRMFARGRCLIR